MPTWVFFGLLGTYLLWGRRYRAKNGELDRRPNWFFALGWILMITWSWLLIVVGTDRHGLGAVVAFVFAGFLLLLTACSIYMKVHARHNL